MNKNKLRFFILCVVFGLSACNGSDKNKEADADSASTMKLATDSNMITAAIDSNQAAHSSFNWKGTYQGVFPCADCAGIVTEIMLHNDDTYMMSSQYLGKKDSKINNAAGKFKWISDSTLELEGIDGGPSVKYFISDSTMMQLDTNGDKIPGGLGNKFTLRKK